MAEGGIKMFGNISIVCGDELSAYKAGIIIANEFKGKLVEDIVISKDDSSNWIAELNTLDFDPDKLEEIYNRVLDHILDNNEFKNENIDILDSSLERGDEKEEDEDK